MAKKKNPAAVALGKRGAKARMTKLSDEERSAIAKNAATKRWENQPKKKPAKPRKQKPAPPEA